MRRLVMTCVYHRGKERWRRLFRSRRTGRVLPIEIIRDGSGCDLIRIIPMKEEQQ